ncbi:enoyl-CoA hydratase-related protein [Phenylobacterium sp. LH3H17]|uniref:enoyl-CoA hydratase-related protein n=1 Tax=Phenylobacterium sp. LH3H17 TaxID=2903901 RepID=UPI0020C9AF25|nr:enoyl-CoA hydratase-related protein [Phenylobacterium sp. LH3H17]UTP40352.1 enoyl-CoA hydratase-related protein [Phenylobacterium sp. LH3H17]
MSHAYEHILCEVADGIMQVTLNRPDKLNAYTATMGAELAAAFDDADRDDAVRVVLVTGAGRGFCAGADMSAGAGAFDTTSAEGSVSFGDVSKGRSGGSGMVGAVYECRKPSIAAFNGAAVGVGLTLTLPMDIRIAADTAKFGFVFARRGLVPEAGSAWFLPRIVGISQALRWCLDGALFSADDALKGGLVSEVVPAADLLPRARAIARSIADNTAPISVALTRQMLWRLSEEPTPYGALKVDGAMAMALGATPDVREGVAAFLEKRPPRFAGRVSTDMPSSYPWWDR